MTLSITVTKHDTQHNCTKYCYVKSHLCCVSQISLYADCHCAVCRYDECRGAKLYGLKKECIFIALNDIKSL